MTSFLEKLNPVQREAVTFDSGPLLVLAGAGSGKTRVLTTRIAYLVLEKGVAPENILAVTFTNKAAGEMRERLESLIGEEARRLWIGTFHSLGLRILRREGGAIGLQPGMTVYDDDEQLSVVKLCMKELSINDRAVSPRAVAWRIDQAKNENIGPDEYLNHAGDFFAERVAALYALYQRRLREMGALDFGDLICEPIRLFKNNPSILRSYQKRFSHILIDEYQDTNRAQYILTNMLARGNRKICVVGDPDQSIYAWRGADIRNILDFERDWPDATVLRLEQNYRSTKYILGAANSVIENNRKRFEKSLWTENSDGEPVMYRETEDEHEEARFVTSELKRLMDRDHELSYRDFAIFYRTNAQSRVFEEHLLREGIPYTIVGGIRFYDRQEIKDAMAYLRVAANPRDLMAFRRIVNTPPRGIGRVGLDKVERLAVREGTTLLEALKKALSEGLLKKTGGAALIEAFEDFTGNIDKKPLHELALRLLEDSGYIRMWEDEATEEALERVENLHELISAIRDFESGGEGRGLQDFLDQVALISDIDSYEDRLDRLTLMTLHSAKGLEFPVVFMVGMEEGLFPHSRSMDSTEELEEERRLCYVGMTRAMKRLFLVSARTRNLFGETRFQTPSRFIGEISSEFMERDKEEAEVSELPDEPYYTLEDSQVEDAGAAGFRVGMKVMHPSFGIGVIKAKQGSGEGTKLTINFFGAGPKKIILKYASLVPVP